MKVIVHYLVSKDPVFLFFLGLVEYCLNGGENNAGMLHDIGVWLRAEFLERCLKQAIVFSVTGATQDHPRLGAAQLDVGVLEHLQINKSRVIESCRTNWAPMLGSRVTLKMATFWRWHQWHTLRSILVLSATMPLSEGNALPVKSTLSAAIMT